MREKHVYGKDLKIHQGCECRKKEYKGYVENQNLKKKKKKNKNKVKIVVFYVH